MSVKPKSQPANLMELYHNTEEFLNYLYNAITSSDSERPALGCGFLLLAFLRISRFRLHDDHEEALGQEGEELIGGVHRTPLHPLWDGGPGMAESQLLENVVHPNWLNLLATPREEPDKKTRFDMSFIIHPSKSNATRLWSIILL